nr:MAG TPA: hypothetical protein [Bacteriophage sp.]
MFNSDKLKERIHHYNICKGQYAYIVFLYEKSEHKKCPSIILKELLILNQLIFIERRKIKKKSANYQLFLQLFLILIEINRN